MGALVEHIKTLQAAYTLNATQLARLDLPETLHEAVMAAQHTRSPGARTRQLQYTGSERQRDTRPQCMDGFVARLARL